MQAFSQTVLRQHRSAGARQKLLARLQEHVAAINSNDLAEGAGGCGADGSELLASLGLDGPPPPRESALAKRTVSPAFVLFWEYADTDISWPQSSQQSETSSPGGGGADGGLQAGREVKGLRAQ